MNDRLRCFCAGGRCPANPGHVGNGSCLAEKGAKCFAAVQEIFDAETHTFLSEQRTFGCLPPDHSGGLMQCMGHLVPHLNPTSIACCSDVDFCNQHLRPSLYSHQAQHNRTHSKDYDYYYYDDYYGGSGYDAAKQDVMFGLSLSHVNGLILLVSLTVCLVIFIIMTAYLYLRYKSREDSLRSKYALAASLDPDTDRRWAGRGGQLNSAAISSGQLCPASLSELMEHSSGSGGLPLLVQRTIAKQIQMLNSIGKGRFGEVWHAKWRGEDVAVKVFATTDEASWFRETEIYQSVLMRHENILGFIAADIRGSGGWTQMMLITEFHMLGSLHDYLGQNAFTVAQMIRLCHSAAAGLSYLHTEIMGTRGKPAIAHRDVKARNILVRKDISCVIADFGLAVRYDSMKNELDEGGHNVKSGTIRFMAPEKLELNIQSRSESVQHSKLKFSSKSNADVFASHTQADVYSLALVIWQIMRKALTGSTTMTCDDYQQPYYDVVSTDPSYDEMHAVVSLKQIRPAVSSRWMSSSATTERVVKLVNEMWHPNPQARPSALRVKKTLTALLLTATNTQFGKSNQIDNVSSSSGSSIKKTRLDIESG